MHVEHGENLIHFAMVVVALVKLGLIKCQLSMCELLKHK